MYEDEILVNLNQKDFADYEVNLDLLMDFMTFFGW